MKGDKGFSITIEQYGAKYSIQLDHDDIDIEQYYEYCKSLALAMGFHPNSIREYFKED